MLQTSPRLRHEQRHVTSRLREWSAMSRRDRINTTASFHHRCTSKYWMVEMELPPTTSTSRSPNFPYENASYQCRSSQSRSRRKLCRSRSTRTSPGGAMAIGGRHFDAGFGTHAVTEFTLAIPEKIKGQEGSITMM